MAVIEITSEEQFVEILRNNAKVVANFTDTSSGPCKLINPVFKMLSEEYQDIVFVSVDVDKVASLARDFQVSAMPTFIMFRGGLTSDLVRGANKGALEDKVKLFAA
ncbi:thioredoxin family protein [Nocardia sp. NPDC051321]|uniref:thioredoxin family protein n=1 Tax=Nocardia sp. NPDC051321 TaxID=3364323 RepID=UPI00379F8270